MMRVGMLVAAMTVAPAVALQAQEPARPDSAAVAAAAGTRVYLMTMGQGTYIWEKFGHNAIWIIDEARGIDVAYNWGLFDFDEPGYIGRLIRGNMMYWMQGFNGQAMANAYVGDNRSIWVQELNLTPMQKAELIAFTEWNSRDENKYYRYDYYRDNCSTRVRDALDRVLGGALRRALEGKATGTTYRMHTERLTADMLAEYSGLVLALGPSTDRPIDAWEESFLPVPLMEHLRSVQVPGEGGEMQPLVLSESQAFAAARPAERAAAPNRLAIFGACGVGLALLFIALAHYGARSRANVMLFAVLAFIWSLVAGIAGSLIAGLWAFTAHTITYSNENVLQANPLSLVLAVMLIPFALGRLTRPATLVALAVAFLALLGFVLQVLPGLDQVNGTLIALTLPAHAGLAQAMVRLSAARNEIPLRA
jgi:hypothetical protein